MSPAKAGDEIRAAGTNAAAALERSCVLIDLDAKEATGGISGEYGRVR